MTLTSEFPLLAILMGACLLLLGRRLYILFVLCVGFVAGTWLTAALEIGGPPWVRLAIALFLGILGAVLALVAQKIAVALAGFLVGGTLAFTIVDAQHISLEGAAWLLPLLAAVVAALLALALFDTALVVLSSLLGAALLVEASGAAGMPALMLFVVLLTVGVALQSRALVTRRRRAESRT